MFLFNIHNHYYSHVHFIGIGGISMSGLAEILLSEGYKVTGSDMKDSPILRKLENKGAKVFIGHNKENIEGADLIIYTDAISNDNPEYTEANNLGVTTIDRGTFLGQLMKGYKKSIAVSGTHGKTTTTGMLSVILDRPSLEPTILLGGELDKIGGNVKIGKGDFFLTEACEYKGNILKFHPMVGIILNIEEDHLDYFQDIDHIIKTFSNFAQSIPKDGYLIANGDDKYVLEAIKDAKCNIVTFGTNSDCTYRGSNVTFGSKGLPRFDLEVNGQNYKVELSVMGLHNVYNTMAAIAATRSCGLSIEEAIEGIKDYGGTHRRLEDKGLVNGIRIIDSYAHHPTAVKADLDAVSKINDNNVWCVFQPHTYTRTKALLSDFADSFHSADKVIVADIYAAREKDTGEIHSKDLVKSLISNNINAKYLSSFEEIVDFLSANVSKGDIVIILGAGDIYKVGEMMLEQIRREN